MQKQPKRIVKKTLSSALLMGGAAISMGLMAGTSAMAQQQCATYVVERGDTLSKIANRADVRGGYQALFSANSNVLSNPNIVTIGQLLQIPCADGSLATRAIPLTPVAFTPEPAPTVEKVRPLRIVTGGGYAPFTDEDLEGGGAMTMVVDRAVTEGNADQEFSITFVNDWGSHLETLLPLGAMDMAFPWFKPDCSKVEFLSEASAFRCTAFNHSDPLYDALVGFFTLKGGAYEAVTSYSELKGATLCRPEAWFTFDLEAEQLMPPNVELVRSAQQNGCWQKLVDGEVDVVTLDVLPAQEDYRELGLTDQVASIEALTSSQTMHVFVSKDNKLANDALPIINQGLEKLRLSGEWFSIVSSNILETVEN